MVKKAITAIVLISILIFGCVSVANAPPLSEHPSKESMIEFFKENKAVFQNIVTTLKDVDEDLSFDTRDGEDINSIGKIDTDQGVIPYDVPTNIKDDVKKVIYTYKFVCIYKTDDLIYFDKEVGFQWSKALIYSINGIEPPQNKAQEFEEIGDGWYYYSGE